MRALILGAGPAGLYCALLLRKAQPNAEVHVIERNAPHDTFGWGVVFSDQTLENLQAADPPSADRILNAFHHWDDIEIHIRDQVIRTTGHGFIGIGRHRLLGILQDRCREVGVQLHFGTDVPEPLALLARYDPDVVVAADGIHSRTREAFAGTYRPDVDVRRNRYVWLGTRAPFDAFTFAFRESPHGWFQAHAYQFDQHTSTFIVETPERVWEAAGLGSATQEESVRFCEELFRPYLRGHALLTNASHQRGSAFWTKFPRVVCETWTHWVQHGTKRVPFVLMGDAAHTAHFSIGSGTKLALEDAISFSAQLQRHADLPAALAEYEAERHVEVLKLQSAARNSTEWFENVHRYANLPPRQFAYSLLTRSQRISHENLRVRDPAFVESYEDWLARQSGAGRSTGSRCRPPMLTPFTVRDLTLKNRVVVSPMAMYSADQGTPNDFHLVHLGARALGGAAMIFTEMTCVSADARITPGCAGMYAPEHPAAWRRVVNFVHEHTDAKIAIQLGHAGPKGSTRRAWDGTDLPLTDPSEPNWPLIAASEQQYVPGVSQTARPMTRADMDRVTADFVTATRMADEAGFDWLELHCAHGYLLSSFISPLTNHRTDAYGGSLDNRLRYPLEVFRAVRHAWPARKPISVRISAHDWVEGGITPDDAVRIARAFRDAGADMIDCSSGQVSKLERPTYGRMYQTPFADRVRNEAGIPTIAVGAIFEADHANSIIAAGRADLVAIARPHLADAAWTLHEAAKLGITDVPWPKQYWPGKQQLERNLARAQQANAPKLRETV